MDELDLSCDSVGGQGAIPSSADKESGLQFDCMLCTGLMFALEACCDVVQVDGSIQLFADLPRGDPSA